MPAFNASGTVLEVVQSILTQTYQSLEVIIVDDGSTDDTLERIQSFQDPRIQIIGNERNRGLINSLNDAMSRAQGEYIVRMDADDVSLASRIAVQFEFTKRVGCDISGSWIKKIGTAKGVVKYPLQHEDIRIALLFGNPIVHPSVFFHRRLLDEKQFHYDLEWRHVEDYELWTRLMDKYMFATLNKPLLKYRISGGSVCNKYGDE